MHVKEEKVRDNMFIFCPHKYSTGPKSKLVETGFKAWLIFSAKSFGGNHCNSIIPISLKSLWIQHQWLSPIEITSVKPCLNWPSPHPREERHPQNNHLKTRTLRGSERDFFNSLSHQDHLSPQFCSFLVVLPETRKSFWVLVTDYWLYCWGKCWHLLLLMTRFETVRGRYTMVSPCDDVGHDEI